MNVNEAALARASLQRSKEQAFPETCYHDDLKPDPAIRTFFSLLACVPGGCHITWFFQTEVIYLNMDYLKNGKGYRA